MSEKKSVLLMGPLMPRAVETLSTKFNIHRLFESQDPEAMLDKLAPSIQGIAAIGGSSPVNEAFICRFPNLEIIANYGVGYDTIDVKCAISRGIMVTNTPDVLTEDVADLTLGLLLATIRRLPQADRFVRAGGWLSGNFPLTGTLQGKHVGIVGLGRIGKAVAKRLEAFGVPIAYFGRRAQPDISYSYYDSLIKLAQESDILIIVVPGGQTTHNLITADILHALGPQGVLINVARGSVIDEQAMINALKKGQLGAAGLDVFAAEPHVPHELIAMENVVLLPHVGSASISTREAMAQLTVDNLISWLTENPAITPIAEMQDSLTPKRHV